MTRIWLLLRRSLSRPLVRILLVVLLSRIILTLIGVQIHNGAFSYTQGVDLGPPRTHHTWLNVWGVWDAGWYLDVAEHGYQRGNTMQHAFFPLYPELVRSISLVTGHTYVVGLIVGNLAFVISCWLLYVFARRLLSPKPFWPIWYLVAFPSAFVLSGMFSEPLFLCLTLGAFLAADKRQWWLAGLLAAGAMLTRSLGVAVGLGLAWQFLRQRPRPHWYQAAWLLLIPLAVVGWMAINARDTGDPLAFVHVQSEWRRHATTPIQALWVGITAPSLYDRASAWFWIGLMVVMFTLRRRVPGWMNVYAWATFIIPLTTGIYSLPRYALIIFPLFLGLAQAQIRAPIRWAIVLTLAVIQVGLFLYWPMPNSWVV